MIEVTHLLVCMIIQDQDMHLKQVYPEKIYTFTVNLN